MSSAAVLAAGLLFYSLRGIEWRQVAQIAAQAKLRYLGLAAAIATGNLLLRSIRWRLLLNAQGTVHVRVSTAFWATAAGYFGNNFLPARGGELVRTLMIGSRSGLDNVYVLATALSERVADAVALVVIAAVALLTLPMRPGWTAAAAKPFATLGIIGALAIAILPRLEWLARIILSRAPLPESFRPRALSMMEAALRGMRSFHDLHRLLAFLGLTIVIWSLDALATVVGGAALGFAMPVAVAFLLLASLGLGSAFPSTPGYVGIYQFVAVTVLTPFGFSRNDAIAYILIAQALSYVVIGFWGGWGFFQSRRHDAKALPRARLS